jgi:cytoskeletal protein CcmA (bactofilin family)
VFGRTANPDNPDPKPQGTRSEKSSAASNPGAQFSVIGPDLSIIGQRITLVCKSSLTVTGEVLGDINGSEVTVGETGRVTGIITARTISVHGTVQGALRAESVTLHSTADIEGDIIQKNLVIAEGAKFDGRVRAVNDPSEIEPVFDVAALNAAAFSP